jgi:uncharacterized membrane protein YkvA (DUF1232 family)
VFALLYILNPIDIIPDVIPIFGYLDDVMVFGFCLDFVEADLEKYGQMRPGDHVLPFA